MIFRRKKTTRLRPSSCLVETAAGNENLRPGEWARRTSVIGAAEFVKRCEQASTEPESPRTEPVQPIGEANASESPANTSETARLLDTSGDSAFLDLVSPRRRQEKARVSRSSSCRFYNSLSRTRKSAVSSVSDDATCKQKALLTPKKCGVQKRKVKPARRMTMHSAADWIHPEVRHKLEQHARERSFGEEMNTSEDSSNVALLSSIENHAPGSSPTEQASVSSSRLVGGLCQPMCQQLSHRLSPMCL